MVSGKWQINFYKISELLRALLLVDRCVYMRVFKHRFGVLDSRVFLRIILLKHVYIALSKYSGSLENSGTLCKLSTTNPFTPTKHV